MEQILEKLAAGKDLTSKEAQEAMTQIMSGQTKESQIESFLVSLKEKGESIEEISAFAKVLRSFAVKINPKVGSPLVDTCGAGGDLLDTFNISTTSAFVVAGAGVPVAKHGNRKVSSQSGSADVLSELGVNLEASPENVIECIEKVGIGFMFAPLYHNAMKYVAPVRKKLGVRTVFNILGPLISPADVKRQVYGIYDGELTEKLAGVLKELGSEHAMVVHGIHGLDELSTLGKTKVSELKDGKIETYLISPEELDLPVSEEKELLGGGQKENAQILKEILTGKMGPKRNIVLLNAGAAIYVAGKAESIQDGIKLAEESIDSGAAYKKLKKLVEVSNA